MSSEMNWDWLTTDTDNVQIHKHMENGECQQCISLARCISDGKAHCETGKTVSNVIDQPGEVHK